jgi:hypothetical protein
MPSDPAIIDPPSGKFSEAEMARWPQYSGVRRVALASLEYEDQFMLVRSLHETDARTHFARHGFEYQGRLAFIVAFRWSPAWLIKLSLAIGRLAG